MNILIYLFIMLATFLMMEIVAWAIHKYVMHGFLWTLHKDHHVKEAGFFEKNDTFFLVFAIPSWLCIMLGMMYGAYVAVAVGLGIALYGMAYFFVHDIFIHQRFRWFRKTDNTYFRAIRNAHRTHHKYLSKEDGECFGMLYVSKQYLEEAKQMNKVTKK